MQDVGAPLEQADSATANTTNWAMSTGIADGPIMGRQAISVTAGGYIWSKKACTRAEASSLS